VSTATDEIYSPDTVDPAYDMLIWRMVRGTVWGTVDLAKLIWIEGRFRAGVLVTRSRMAVKRYRASRRFADGVEPDPDEIPGRRWSPTRYSCLDCGRAWKTPEAAGAHFERVHAGKLVRDVADRAGDRLFVRPRGRKVKVTGIRRPPNRTPDTRSVWTQIGVKAMESGIALRMKQAWQEFRDAKPRFLSEIRNDLLGLEQVLGIDAEGAIMAYRMHLIRMGFDVAILQNLVRATEGLAEAAARFSSAVGVIDEALAADIAAAKAQKNGAKPSVDVLAN
jgi:hypothetical protein